MSGIKMKLGKTRGRADVGAQLGHSRFIGLVVHSEKASRKI